MDGEKNKNERSRPDLKPIVSELLEQSGEVAPVDFGQFERRAGEIIARAAHGHGRRY